VSVSAPDGAGYRPLTGRTAFANTYRTADRVRRGGIVVLAVAGEAGMPRVGIVAGKRVGGAVARNRAKRRLRATLREVSLAEDTTYVVIADAEVVDADYRRLVGWLQSAVDQLRSTN